MNETHPSIEQIVDFLHGEAAAEDAAIRAHLAGCPSCEQRRADEVALTEVLRAHARATERDVPPALLARIRAESIRPAPPSMWQWMRGAFRPALVLPVAAAIAVALYVGLTFRPRTTSTAIDAAYYVNEHVALAARTPFADDMPPAMLTADDEAR
jgi:anti-sigma factor RsiW